MHIYNTQWILDLQNWTRDMDIKLCIHVPTSSLEYSLPLLQMYQWWIFLKNIQDSVSNHGIIKTKLTRIFRQIRIESVWICIQNALFGHFTMFKHFLISHIRIRTSIRQNIFFAVIINKLSIVMLVEIKFTGLFFNIYFDESVWSLYHR